MGKPIMLSTLTFDRSDKERRRHSRVRVGRSHRWGVAA